MEAVNILGLECEFWIHKVACSQIGRYWGQFSWDLWWSRNLGWSVSILGFRAGVLDSQDCPLLSWAVLETFFLGFEVVKGFLVEKSLFCVTLGFRVGFLYSRSHGANFAGT